MLELRWGLMPSLKVLKTLFCDTPPNNHDGIAKIPTVSLPPERLLLYRSHIFHNLCNTLKMTFRGTVRLLGEENFEKLCLMMLSDQTFWPETGSLEDLGEEWCRFVRQSEFGQTYLNVCDFCDYEWQKHVIFSLPQQEADIPDISLCDESSLLNIRFDFVPACVPFYSEHAVDHIEEYIEGAADEEYPDRPSYAIILKSGDHIKTLWLTYEVWIVIYLLYHKYSLAHTVEELGKEDIEFDINTALEILFTERIAHTVLP